MSNKVYFILRYLTCITTYLILVIHVIGKMILTFYLLRFVPLENYLSLIWRSQEKLRYLLKICIKLRQFLKLKKTQTQRNIPKMNSSKIPISKINLNLHLLTWTYMNVKIHLILRKICLNWNKTLRMIFKFK